MSDFWKRAHDQELEQALLGTLLVDPAMVPFAAEHIEPADFYTDPHPAIFELMLDYEQAGKPITPLTLAAWLKHDENFAKAGGHSYLAELALSAPASIEKARPALVADVAKDLKKHALRRLALSAINDASADLVEGKPVVAALSDVVVVADEIAAREAEGQEGARLANQVTHRLLRDVETQAVSERAYTCKTGIDSLDKIIGGLVPGHAIFIGGRPGMGKTIVGSEVCIAAARQGWEPDYFSLEMPGRELGARMICSLAYDESVEWGDKHLLEYKDLIQLSASADLLHRAARVNTQKLADLPIEIFDFEDITMARIAAICRSRAAKAARRGVRKLFIVDHLGLIEPDERYRGRKVDELTLITKRTKQLAKRTGCPVVMLCQLNREVEGRDDKRPRIADFRDSGSIEQDADLLIGLYRHDYYVGQRSREARHKGEKAEGQALAESDRLHEILELEVLKQRSGGVGTARCHIKVEVGALRNEAPKVRVAAGFGFTADAAINQLDTPPTHDVPELAYADEISKGER